MTRLESKVERLEGQLAAKERELSSVMSKVLTEQCAYSNAFRVFSFT